MLDSLMKRSLVGNAKKSMPQSLAASSVGGINAMKKVTSNNLYDIRRRFKVV
jgi:hypothetical protein